MVNSVHAVILTFEACASVAATVLCLCIGAWLMYLEGCFHSEPSLGIAVIGEAFFNGCPQVLLQNIAQNVED